MNDGQIALIIAVISLVFSVMSAFAARKQAEQAEKDVLLSLQVSKGDATSHFTDRFFDLLREVKQGGIEEQILKNSSWAYQFWSLHATEFYFFHHGILPTFMYSLWMVDLAQLYASSNGEKIRASHVKYLETYSLNYDEMTVFYDSLFQFARAHGNPSVRNKEIATWIKHWIASNKRDIFE